MTLSHPTIAQQAIDRFEAATKTISLVSIAYAMGGRRISGYPIEYLFDDDSTLRIIGRGRAHKYEALLP